MDDAFDGACAGFGETESEQALLNKLYDVTLAVLSGISGREVEELRGVISDAEQVVSAKVDQACTIIKTAVTGLADKIWNSTKMKAQGFMGAVAKCFMEMGKAIKQKCGPAFKAVGDRFLQFAEKLPSLAKTREANAQGKPQPWVAKIKQAIASKLSSKGRTEEGPSK
jgi:hypothetical protein